MSLFPFPTLAQCEAARRYEELRRDRRYLDAARLLRAVYERDEGPGFLGEVFRLRYLQEMN